MRKIAGHIVLWVAVIVFIVSSVDDFTRILTQAKYVTKSWWGSDKYTYGDLFGMSYLPQYKIPDPAPAQPVYGGCKANMPPYHIYAISDSYTWSIFKNKGNFCGATESGYAAANFRDILPVNLDTTVKNIVVLECNERNIRELFTDTAYLTRAIHPLKPGEDTSKIYTSTRRKAFHFNYKMKDADANFEFNLWDYRFLNPIKEFKAWLTYKWFNRTSIDVITGDDKKHLLFHETIDTALLTSSFKPVGHQEIDQLVNNLNLIDNRYKQAGFAAVYLAIIPNPVTVLYPNHKGYTYNQLIPRIQDNIHLKMRVFDSYNLFMANRDKELYLKSDTHWAISGEKLWINALNDTLQHDLPLMH